MIPTLRRDGRQVVFSGTDGAFSVADHEATGAEPFGDCQTYISDLDVE